MIYQLNNETHWYLSPELIRELVKMLATRPARSTDSTTLDIELANCRAALEAELYRIRTEPAETPRSGATGKLAMEGPADTGAADGHANPPADNSDLI